MASHSREGQGYDSGATALVTESLALLSILQKLQYKEVEAKKKKKSGEPDNPRACKTTPLSALRTPNNLNSFQSISHENEE